MQNPIPLTEPDLSGNERKYLQECIESGFVSSIGPFVERFEHLVAEVTGCANAVAVNSGTAGLHLALTTIGVGKNDLVVVPSYSFIASANAVAHCGARPWFIDIDESSWTMDVTLLEKMLDSETVFSDGNLIHKDSGEKIAAVMPVHVFGHPAEMNSIVKLCNSFGIPVIADAAAALGATYRGNKIGQTGADISVFSFNGNKSVTSGGGGAIVSDNTELLNHARHLSMTGRKGSTYDHDCIAFNYRMTNLQAAVGCAQVERLEKIILSKRNISAKYQSAFFSLEGIEFFPQKDWAESACWISGIFIKPTSGIPIAKLREAINNLGIATHQFWKPLHLQKPYFNCLKSSMDISDEIWEFVLPLPCSSTLSDLEQERIIMAVSQSLEELGF